MLHDDAERRPEVSGIKIEADDKIRRVVLCSGKVYYDLLEDREKKQIKDVYLMRLEQFYPWPMKSLMTELARFKNAELVWCQEEPKNMGGWTFVEPWLELTLDQPEHQGQARPLCRSSGLGLDRRRHDEPPPQGTRNLPERSLRLTTESRTHTLRYSAQKSKLEPDHG